MAEFLVKDRMCKPSALQKKGEVYRTVEPKIIVPNKDCYSLSGGRKERKATEQ